MNESPEDTEQLSHIVVLNEKGQRTQVIELPAGIKPADIEAFVAGDRSSWSHVPADIALSGGTQLGPPKLFIPEGKAEKELFLGKLALPVVSMIHELGNEAEIVSNPADPPDLLASTMKKQVGIELCELIYRDRYPRDSALTRIERAVRSLISAEDYAQFHLNFLLKQTHEGKVPLPSRPAFLAALRELTDLLNRGKGLACIKGAAWLLLEEHLPESCRTFLYQITVDNIGDQLPVTRERPIITFSNAAQEISEQVLRAIVNETVGRKLDMRLQGTNVLLIWSCHPSFKHCISETCAVVTDLLLSRMRSSFADVLYLHRSTENVLAALMTNRSIRVHVVDDVTQKT